MTSGDACSAEWIGVDCCAQCESLCCSALPQFRLAQIFEKVSDLCDTMLRADDDDDTGRRAQRSGRDAQSDGSGAGLWLPGLDDARRAYARCGFAAIPRVHALMLVVPACAWSRLILSLSEPELHQELRLLDPL